MVQQFTVVFLIVVLGYYLLSRSNHYRERSLAGSNYALFYESTIAGGTVFSLGFAVVVLIKLWFQGCVNIDTPTLEMCEIDKHYPIPFIDILALSTLTVAVFVYFGNLKLTDREISERIARQSGNVANIVLDAQIGNHLAQVTTVRGKVYIGWLSFGPGLSKLGKPQDLAVVPLYSGHRDPVTQRVSMDVDYSFALDEYIELVNRGESEGTGVNEARTKPPRQMSVVIPIEEVALVRRYNEELTETLVSLYGDADLFTDEDAHRDIQRF